MCVQLSFCLLTQITYFHGFTADWFHGEAFGIELGSVSNLAGFKCPKCRRRSVPVCPYSKDSTSCVLLKQSCNLAAETVDVQHKQCIVKLQNADCEYCLDLVPCEVHSELKRQVPAHCGDEIGGEIISDQSSIVHPSGHEE